MISTVFKYCSALCLSVAVVALAASSASADEKDSPLTMVVMDPLAAPLSCPCVEGYAQRDYTVLAEHLSKSTNRNVKVVFAESLPAALKKTRGKVDLVIGKQSIVRADAKLAKVQMSPVSQLTDQKGNTTQYGMIVVNKEDPAKSVGDLADYTIIFGPSEAEEKHSAAIQLLEAAGVQIPLERQKIDDACSDGACKVIDLGPKSKTAAVISSYAQPLLEGCGTIKKGDLRVVGKTTPVPFVTVFLAGSLAATVKVQLTEGLADAALQPQVLQALESLVGFIPMADAPKLVKKKVVEPTNTWPGWLGPLRNGHVAWLPSSLPTEPDVVWDFPLVHAGLGGIAATEKYVIFGDRDQDDFQDVFRCLDAKTGAVLWEVQRLAAAALDYGNSPRSTPLIFESTAICQGALGNLLCIELSTGKVRWEINLRDEFPLQTELPWGYCGSPLIADGKLIVAPGAPDASLVALNPRNGELLWKTPGLQPSHGSMISVVLGGVQQIVGHDQRTLGGWDLQTGKRLWTVEPRASGDFNVPTPVVRTNKQGQRELLVATKNNGIRSMLFQSTDGTPSAQVAHSMKLRTTMSTPIVIGNKIFCVKDFLFCLNAADLSERWRLRDRAFGDHAATFATEEYLLVIGKGELLLMAIDGKKILSRCTVFDQPQVLYSHPALLGNRLFIRGEHGLKCINLNSTENSPH